MSSRNVDFKRPGAGRPLALLVLLLSLIACDISTKTDKKGVIKSGCFKCHPEKVTHSSVHKTHMQMGLRCEQCHESQKTLHGAFVGDTCLYCHNLKEFPIGTGKRQVWFDHERHMEEFHCKRCHKGIFPMKRGFIRITMTEIQKGRYCGACHNGKRAFSYQRCNRCHTKSKEIESDSLSIHK